MLSLTCQFKSQHLNTKVKFLTPFPSFPSSVSHDCCKIAFSLFYERLSPCSQTVHWRSDVTLYTTSVCVCCKNSFLQYWYNKQLCWRVVSRDECVPCSGNDSETCHPGNQEISLTDSLRRVQLTEAACWRWVLCLTLNHSSVLNDLWHFKLRKWRTHPDYSLLVQVTTFKRASPLTFEESKWVTVSVTLANTMHNSGSIHMHVCNWVCMTV